MLTSNIAEPILADTFIHRIDPRVKILALVLLGLAVVSLDNSNTMIALLLIVLLGYPLARIPMPRLKILAILLILSIWGTILSQALFYNSLPRTVIMTLVPAGFPILGSITGGIFIYNEGLQYGAVQGLRSAIMLSMGLLVSWTTDARNMLNGLVRLKVPYNIAFMVVVSLRFLPIIVAEISTIITVQRLRGFRPSRAGPGTVSTAFNTLVPALSSCVRRAGMLAVSVEGRAFRAFETRTYLKELRLSKFDVLLLSALVSVVAFVVIDKLLFVLYVNDIFYTSDLRGLYSIARLYM